MSFLKSIPAEVESVTEIMSRYMDQTEALFGLTEIIMRTGECSLSAKQRELIAAYTSGVNGCDYCYGTHTSTAEAFGIEVGLLESMIADIESADVSDNMKPILSYVRKLTLTPSRLVQSDVDSIFQQGWTENDFHYVVMNCALFNFYNRLINGYGVVNTPSYRANHGLVLAEHGYQL